MIRITLLTLLIAYLSSYAWKNWFRAACWLVLLMSIFQHPDMPKSIAGVPGLNHWNFLFLNVVLSWLANRKKEKLSWEMPGHLNFLLFIYSFFIILSVLRYLSDPSGSIRLEGVSEFEASLGISAINEYLINCFKWVFPAFIIFDGARDRNKYNFAVLMLVLMYLILAFQVIKQMKLGSLGLSGESLQRKALKVLSNSVGYHRVNISMIMSGAFWAVFCLKEYVSSKHFYLLIIPSCLSILAAMAMTGGRTGYATWGLLGFVFCLFKWRKYFLLAPVVLIAITIAAPSAVERMMMGLVDEEETSFDESSSIEFDGNNLDTQTITSGRSVAWPEVWKEIGEAPFLGYGRNAMMNTGVTQRLLIEQGESFPHPHNAYLEWLLDNGSIAAIPVFLFYFLMLKYSWSLLRDKKEVIYVVAGGMSFSLICAFLLAGSGSQTFYPREGAVGMWVGMGLMLRVYIERKKVSKGGVSELINPTIKIESKYFVK